MKLLVGPVLGHVSDRKVRILVEINEPGDLTLNLYPFDGIIDLKGKITIERKNCTPHRPFIIQVEGKDGLKAGTFYYYQIINEGNVLATSVFKIHLPDEPLRALVVSCNALHLLEKTDVDLWKVMLDNHIGEGERVPDIGILLHIGDQIYEYAREVWKRCYNYMNSVQEGNGYASAEHLMSIDKALGYKGEWTAKKQIYSLEDVKEIMAEMFRSLYRTQWSHEPLRVILSKVSNEMVLDDHDIRNGWGILPEDRNPDTIEHTIGVAAYKAYLDYQVQLWRDLDDNYHIDHRMLRRGKTAIFLMDVRNPRTFCYNANAPYMGFEQLNTLKDLLSDNTVEDLLLVCSIPILLSSQRMTSLASKIDLTCDIRDQWCQGPYIGEHCKLLGILSDWKLDNPNHNLMLVGGDIHMGLHSVMSFKDQFICEQVVTSPITNLPTQGLAGWLQNIFISSSFVLYDKFKVKHDFRLHKRNYVEIFMADEKWQYKFYYS